MRTYSYYLERLFHPDKLQEAVDLAKAHLADVEYDSIAVRGVSGMVFGGALSYATGKGLIVVRKKDEHNHSGLQVEGVPTRSYIFVDDLISSGDTEREVTYSLSKSLGFEKMEYKGSYLYNSESWKPK